MGLFVVFEGGDGAGKSWQAAALTEWLTGRGREVVRTFEPGDSAPGRRIRELLLSPETGYLAPKAEALLYAADRAHHVDAVIRPALERGAVVISDRYVDSTLAYQGAGRTLDVGEVAWLNTWATDGLRPDLTILMDLDPTVGLQSRANPDRIEAAGDDFHRRVRGEFLALAGRDPGRYLVLDARAPKAANVAAIRDRVGDLLDLSDGAGRLGS